MLRKRISAKQRPNYYRNQLLLETDLLAEQHYHRSGRQGHNKMLHGTGIVRGLAVAMHTETSVLVNPGLAIDIAGREMLLEQAEILELTDFQPNDRIIIALLCEEPEPESAESRFQERVVWLTAAPSGAGNAAAIILATLQLDASGKVIADSISNSKTYAKAELGQESVDVRHLVPALKTGWLRLPPYLIPLVDKPQGEDTAPAPFRIGITRAVSPTHKGAGENDPGAGGSLAIAIPPGMRKITRFRIAGEENEGDIHIKLYMGGWDLRDPNQPKHMRKILLEQTICRCEAHFLHTYDIGETDVDSEYHTLALWLRCTRRASLSLFAIEFGY